MWGSNRALGHSGTRGVGGESGWRKSVTVTLKVDRLSTGGNGGLAFVKGGTFQGGLIQGAAIGQTFKVTAVCTDDTIEVPAES